MRCVAIARSGDPSALRQGGALDVCETAMFRQLDMPFEEALDFLRSQLTIAFSTEDIQEGVRAFFEKREASWKGR